MGGQGKSKVTLSLQRAQSCQVFSDCTGRDWVSWTLPPSGWASWLRACRRQEGTSFNGAGFSGNGPTGPGPWRLVGKARGLGRLFLLSHMAATQAYEGLASMSPAVRVTASGSMQLSSFSGNDFYFLNKNYKENFNPATRSKNKIDCCPEERWARWRVWNLYRKWYVIIKWVKSFTKSV